MKLFVWNESHSIPYGGCALFAVARTETQAREIVKLCPHYAYFFDTADRDKVGYLGENLGPPSRVVDLPCAEFHWWSE